MSIAKSGKKHPLFGKKMSIATKRRMSKSHMGIKVGMLGKKHSFSTRQKLKKTRAKQIFTKETRKKMSLALINKPNKKFRNTSIEQKITKELEKRGLKKNIDFLQNKGVMNIANVDFYFPKHKKIIECDGCFHHACKKHGNPKYHQNVPLLDHKKTKLLSKEGFKVYRFWEHDINTSVSNCVDKVL